MGNWKDLIDYRHVDDLEIPEMYLWSAFSPFWKGIVYHRLSHWEVLCKYIIGYIYMDKIMDRSRVGPCISSILTSDGGPRAERNSEVVFCLPVLEKPIWPALLFSQTL